MTTTRHIIPLLSTIAVTGVICAAQDTRTVPRPIIRASDVVFMYAARDASQYDAYQGTVTGWGGRPRTREPGDVQSFRERVQEAHQRGMRYCGSVDFLVDFAGFIDYKPDTFRDAICVDLDGNPLRVPWLWDHTHKGHPAYWFCFNHSDYQGYLRDQTERACLAPIDGLHIDDYAGTSACARYNGGCFCEACMLGFWQYLKSTYRSSELRARGIQNIDDFHYQRYLKEQGVTQEQIRRERHRVPFNDLFQEFQAQSMLGRIRDIFEYAEELRGKPLVRSINSSASSPWQLTPAPLIDYFCGEVNHHAAGDGIATEPVFVYRLVEAVGRRQTSTAAGQDWAWIKANEKPGLVRTWIAQAYAFGSVLMAPHRQWCYTQELGTHWWSGSPEDFAYVYNFVRQNEKLFDEYKSLSNTALLYSDENFRPFRNAAERLSESNIPFSIVWNGDERFISHLKPLKDSPYRYRIAATKTENADDIPWDGIAALPDAVKQQVSVEGSDTVRVSVRHKPGETGAPIVIHVLNQNYNREKDGVESVDVGITVSEELLAASGSNAEISPAWVHAPGRESLRQEPTSAGGGITVRLGHADFWSVIELRRG